MNRWLHRLLINHRRFHLTVGLLAVVILLSVSAMGALIVQMNNSEDQRWNDILIAEGTTLLMAMNDEANAHFVPYVHALNSLQGDFRNPAVRQAILDSLSGLPHIQAALCLVNGTTLEGSPALESWDWVTDSLRALRGQFAGWRKEIRDCMAARILFRIYPHNGENFYLIADTYNNNNQQIRRIRSSRYSADDAAYLFALVVDPMWIKETVSQHMDSVIFSKDVFFLHTFPEEDGMGILSGGDTLWWFGIRSISGKNRYSFLNDWRWTSNNWFAFRTLCDPPDEDTGSLASRAHQVTKASSYGVGGLLLISGALFLFSLVQMRRHWLSRQVALEHVTHSIRTPVARLKLDAETMLASRLTSPETEHEILQAINRECGRLERTVQNAALSIRNDKLTVRPTRLHLTELLTELKTAWQFVFDQQQVELDYQADDSIWGDFDRDLLAVLFDNLIDNALRHARLNHASGNGGTAKVSIYLSRKADNIVFLICDTGAGIHPKDLKRIFERFERGSNKSLSDTSGLGLGLSLASEIVLAHHGTISAENSPSGGACFRVILPLTQSD